MKLFYIILTLVISPQVFAYVQNQCEVLSDFSVESSPHISELVADEVVLKSSCDRHLERNIFSSSFKRVNQSGDLYLPFANDTQAQRDQYLCGKYLFFFLPLPTQDGIPQKYLNELLRVFPEHTGAQFSSLGFQRYNNFRNETKPLGLVSAPLGGTNMIKPMLSGDVAQISCAACHVGKDPNGKYVVGLPNTELNLGKFTALTLYPLWLTDPGKLDYSRWDKTLVNFYSWLDKKLGETAEFSNAKWLDSMPSISDFIIHKLMQQDVPPVENQRSYLNAFRGTYNAYSPMLGNKKTFYVTAPPIFHSNVSANGLSGAFEIPELLGFTKQALLYSGITGKNNEIYASTIIKYLICLKVPKNSRKMNESLFKNGRKIFQSKCLSCHDGKYGETSKSYSVSKTQSARVLGGLFANYYPTDQQSNRLIDNMKKDQVYFQGLSDDKIKSKKLNAFWARERIGYSGQILGTDHFLCLNNKKRTNINVSDPKADSLHHFICSDFSISQREALKEYLLFIDLVFEKNISF